MFSATLSAFSLVSILALGWAYPRYQSAIPNGASVPNPCGGSWDGVGHLKSFGTGALNPFGQAFASEGHVWTTALCNADSDQDGISNGAELGDAHCHWDANRGGHLTKATSHPGICEPVGSTQCKWQHFHC